MADSTANTNNNNVSEQQTPQKTFEQIQDMHRAWNTHDKGDRGLAAAEEYIADSTYRESEESDAARRLNRYANTAALFSTDYHDNYNTDIYDKMTDAQKDALHDEYTAAAESLLKQVNNYGGVGRTAEDLYTKGFYEEDVKLSEQQITALQNWMENPLDAQDGNKVIKDLNDLYGANISSTNMVAAKAKVSQIINDSKYTCRVDLSQELLNAAQAVTEKNRKDNISSITKSQIIDTVRTKRLNELKSTDKALQQFMEEHPNATAADWRNLIDNAKRHHGLDFSQSGIDDPVKSLSTISNRNLPLIEANTALSLEEIFGDIGEVTGSTGLYKQDATMGALNFFLGDMGSVISTGHMLGKTVYNFKERAYDRWLKKSKDAKTADYRQKMSEARQGRNSANAGERYKSRNNTRDLKREHRYEKRQTRRYGADRSKWEKYTAKTHKNFDDTLKGRVLNRLNRSPVGKALGKVFNIKKLIAEFVKKLGMGVMKWIGIGILGLIGTAIQLVPLIVIVFYVVATFTSIFSSLKPEYAQNCINNLNSLDKMYMKAVENEVYIEYARQDEDGNYTDDTEFKSPDYHTYIKLDTTQVGQFVNEYGEEIGSGNNILPIFMAFKQRTGCDIDHDTYVAAAAYGQMMYWRTHKIDETTGDDSSNAHLNFRQCAESGETGCGIYLHKENKLNYYGIIPKNTYSNDYRYNEDSKLTYHAEDVEVCNNHSVELAPVFLGMHKCGKIEHPEHTSYCYGPVQICAGITETHTEHDSSCYTTGIVCGLEIHTHDTIITKHGTGKDAYYSNPCFDIKVECLGHCPGHMEAQYTIQCVMDIENIVKYDDLVFTEDSLTYGSTVNNWAGNLENDWRDFTTSISNWWSAAFNTEERFGLNDFYNKYILNTLYGVGNNEAAMFKDYGTSTKAIFYNNYSLVNRFFSDSSLYYPLMSASETGKNNLKKNFTSVEETNGTSWNSSINVRKSTEGLGPDVKTTIKKKYKISNATINTDYDSTDYLSPFLFDSFQLDGRYSTFKNGWGFYQERYRPGGWEKDPDSWTWCVDLKFLQSVTGTYDDGYQYAVDAFYEESGLYFSNAVPSIDMSTTSNTTLKNVVKALKQMEANFPFKDTDIPAKMATAFKHLLGYLNGEQPRGSASKNAYYGTADVTNDSLKAGTILGRKYIVNTERSGSPDNWTKCSYDYYYLYIICEADKSGNWGAGEKYYYCLVYDPDVESQFRFVTMSATSLKLYEKSYQK